MIAQKTYDFLQERVRDRVQNLFDDPVGYAEISEVSSSKPRSQDDPTAKKLRACLEELEGYANDVGLNWKQLVMEESTEYELERVLMYLGYPTRNKAHLPEQACRPDGGRDGSGMMM
jgi:hypothetical protein